MVVVSSESMRTHQSSFLESSETLPLESTKPSQEPTLDYNVGTNMC